MRNDDPEWVRDLERSLKAAENEIKSLEDEVRRLTSLAYKNEEPITYMGEPVTEGALRLKNDNARLAECLSQTQEACRLQAERLVTLEAENTRLRDTIIDECAKEGWLAASSDCEARVFSSILWLKKSRGRAMNKEQIKKIALEVAQDTYLKSDVFCCYKTDEAVVRFATEFLSRIDAERGKEAVVGHYYTRTGVVRLKPNCGALEREAVCRAIPLYFAPQPVVPEGYALVPVEPTEEMKESFYSNVVVLTTGTSLGFNKGYSAMLAAAKEPRHD